MFCLNAVDVKCPICGTINKSLDLEETDGWMECESCGDAINKQMHKRVPVCPACRYVSFAFIP